MIISCSRLILALVTNVLFSLAALPQDAVFPHKTPEAAEIQNTLFVVWEPVITRQWPVLRDLVNAPTPMARVEPGQCVRFGILATGAGRDSLLQKSAFSVDITSAGKLTTLPRDFPAAMKRIKPEGGDFVAQALGAAGIVAPDMSMVSLAISKGHWCAPSDAVSGPVKISVRVFEPEKKDATEVNETIQLQSFADARSKPPFKDVESATGWLQKYHFAPDPAQLLPALRIVEKNADASNSWNTLQFFVSALKDSPDAAHELIQQLPKESSRFRAMAEWLLFAAGYEEVLANATAEKKDIFAKTRFPNAFDMTPDGSLAMRMDMMWAVLFATGEAKTVSSIASMLAWRADNEAIAKLKKSSNKPTELTDSIMRGACYGAAGWSLNALSRSDVLVADYLDAVSASPDTPAEVKSGIASLATNPAFRR